MLPMFRLFCAALALALGLGASVAQAAPVHPDKQAGAFARIVDGIFVRNLQELNFATLGVYDAGTAVIDPNTDTMTTTGGVAHMSGFPYAALFEATAEGANVVITIPTEPITVTRIDGPETMTVDSWTLSGEARRTVTPGEAFTFKVGGTIHVAANQAEGTYEGTFEVDVQYP
jgi:hypothetical protein